MEKFPRKTAELLQLIACFDLGHFAKANVAMRDA